MLATSALKRFEFLAVSLRFTDKSAKKGTLSVNLDEILSEMVEQIRFQKSSFFRPFFIIDKKRSCQNTTVRYFSSSSLKSPFRDEMRPSSC